MNSETQIQGRHFDHPAKPRGFGEQKQIPRSQAAPRNDGCRYRGDKGALTASTRNAMFAEWAKLSPNLDFEPMEGESAKDAEKRLRMAWTNAALRTKADPSPAGRDQDDGGLTSWSQLGEAEGRYLLKRMREESGDGPAYRAMLIARMAQDLFGAAWDRLLQDRLRARFMKFKADDLTPAEAHAEMEELLSRIARRDGIEIEEARSRFSGHKL